jgi:Glyoxalase-like domain
MRSSQAAAPAWGATPTVPRSSPCAKEDAVVAGIGNITFGCDDVLKVAAFWSAVLSRPVDKRSGELFAPVGKADAEWREPKRAKNRVHVDVVDPDPAAWIS